MKNQGFGSLVNFCIYGILKTVSAYAIMPVGKKISVSMVIQNKSP